jgi:hypothetical protein
LLSTCVLTLVLLTIFQRRIPITFPKTLSRSCPTPNRACVPRALTESFHGVVLWGGYGGLCYCSVVVSVCVVPCSVGTTVPSVSPWCKRLIPPVVINVLPASWDWYCVTFSHLWWGDASIMLREHLQKWFLNMFPGWYTSLCVPIDLFLSYPILPFHFQIKSYKLLYELSRQRLPQI